MPMVILSNINGRNLCTCRSYAYVASVTGVAKGSSMHSHTCLYNTDTSTKVIAHALHYPLPHKKGRL